MPHMNRPVLQSLLHMNGVGPVQPESFRPITKSRASNLTSTFCGGCGCAIRAITRGLSSGLAFVLRI